MKSYKQFIEEGKLANLAKKALKVLGKAVKGAAAPHQEGGNISKV